MPLAQIGDIRMNYTVQGTGEWLVMVGGYASGNYSAKTCPPPCARAQNRNSVSILHTYSHADTRSTWRRSLSRK